MGVHLAMLQMLGGDATLSKCGIISAEQDAPLYGVSWQYNNIRWMRYTRFPLLVATLLQVNGMRIFSEIEWQMAEVITTTPTTTNFQSGKSAANFARCPNPDYLNCQA